jgi:hypothetical protein
MLAVMAPAEVPPFINVGSICDAISVCSSR